MSEKRHLYEKRKAIFPKQIWGNSHRWRVICGSIVYGLFFLLPWLQWGDRPVIFFDLNLRQFHIINMTFWPQDFMFLAWALIISAFALFFFTTIAGRLWCGFICPQTIWTFAFVLVEEFIEGSAYQRRKLDKEKLTPRRAAKKLLKHSIWLLLSIITGTSFVAYFYPIQELISDAISLQLSLSALFWVGLFTYLTYIDAGWLREQVCIYMCPYARFQSVMYDENTLAVAYNAEQGEPRLSKNKSDFDSSGKSQCIDCNICVQVCPTGIDIRDGMQIDCINCGLCVDACGDIMDSIKRPRDLIKFNTLNRLQGIKSQIIRPKSIAYFLVLVLMISFFSYELFSRSEIEASIVRDRDRLYQMTKRGTVLNYYTLKLANKSQHSHSYVISVDNDDLHIKDYPTIELKKGGTTEMYITVESAPHKKNVQAGSQALVFKLSSTDGSSQQTVDSRFIYPTP